MKLTALAVLFATTILLTGAIFASSSVQYADAIKGKGVSTSAYGSSTNICGLQLCSDIPGGKAAWEAQQNPVDVVIPSYGLEQKGMSIPSDDAKCNCSEDGTCSCGAGCTCNEDTCSCGESGQCTCGAGCNCSGTSSHGDMKHDGGEMCSSCGNMSGHDSKMSGHEMKAHSGTIQSETDPGQGHKQHQLAVLLPPNSDTYAGLLTYSASENVQLVALHGPLTEDQVMGQTIWTPDGKTKFALTLVDQQNKMGTWMFTGNALAVHTFSTEPFDITYSIVTMGGSESVSVHEARSHGAVCDCAADCNCDADGVCTCSGEAGPCMCGPDCNCGTDETCQCAEGCSCDQEGACICSGEAGPCMCGPDCNCGQ